MSLLLSIASSSLSFGFSNFATHLKNNKNIVKIPKKLYQILSRHIHWGFNIKKLIIHNTYSILRQKVTLTKTRIINIRIKQINNKARNDLLFQHPSKGEYHQPGRA